MAKRGAEKTATKQQVGVPFEPGQSGNPAGRPKGARSKLGEAFIADLAEHWKENGKDALKTAFEKDPAAYVRVVASLLPKDVNIKHTIIEEMEGLSDDELRQRIELLERSVSDGATVSPQTSVH